MSAALPVAIAMGALAAGSALYARWAMLRALGAERSAQWARRHAIAARDRARHYVDEARSARKDEEVDVEAGDVLRALEFALSAAHEDGQCFDDLQAEIVRGRMDVVLAALTRWTEPRSARLAVTLAASLGEVLDALARPRSVSLKLAHGPGEFEDRPGQGSDCLVDLPADAVEVRGTVAELPLDGLPRGRGVPGVHLGGADAHESSPSVGRSPVGAGSVGGAPGASTPGADDPTVGAPTDTTGVVSASRASVEGPAGDGEATAPSPAAAPGTIPDDAIAAWVCPCGAVGYLRPGSTSADRMVYEDRREAHEETCPETDR